MSQAGGRWELRNILDESLGLSPPCFSDLVFEFAFVTALDRNRTRSDFRRNRDREAKTGTALKISKKFLLAEINQKIWQSCHRIYLKGKTDKSIWPLALHCAKLILKALKGKDSWGYLYFEAKGGRILTEYSVCALSYGVVYWSSIGSPPR